MVAGTVGALRAPQREQARPPKRWKHSPCVFGGEGGLARCRSQRPYRDHGIAATHGIAASSDLAQFPHSRDPRHSCDHGIPAIPNNAGGRRGAASGGKQARLSRLIPHPFLTARAGATHTSFKLDQAHAVGIDGGEGGKLVGGGCGREGHVRGLDSEARLLAHLLR